jgi:hypothetical protein
VERAYPELQDNAREQIALTHYLGQLDQPQLAFSVKQRRPKSVDEAVRTTLEMESYLSTPKLTMFSSPDNPQREECSPLAAVGKTSPPSSVMSMLEQIMDRLDNLESRMDKLASDHPSKISSLSTPTSSKSDPPRASRGPIKCHRCGKPGHLAKGCLAPKSQPKFSSGNDRPSM